MAASNSLASRVTLTRDTAAAGTLFGAFRGAVWPFAALCRLLFIASHSNMSATATRCGSPAAA